MTECLFVFIIRHLELAVRYDVPLLRSSILILIVRKGDPSPIPLDVLVGFLVDKSVDRTISTLRNALLGQEAVGS